MPSTMATTFMPAATACARTPLGPTVDVENVVKYENNVEVEELFEDDKS